MGKVVERVKLTNLFDPSKTLEVEALVDTGATMVALPRGMVEALGLRKMREVQVRYANGSVARKEMYGVVTLEMMGRSGEFDVLAEEEGAQPLIGQVVLEVLDLVVDPRRRTLMPNPASPEMPMLDMLLNLTPHPLPYKGRGKRGLSSPLRGEAGRRRT